MVKRFNPDAEGNMRDDLRGDWVLIEQYQELEQRLEQIEIKATAGLCQFTGEGKHCFLKDIKAIAIGEKP